MRKVVLRFAFFVLPLAVGGWAAGCSSDDAPAGVPTREAGPDTAVDKDTSPPPLDAADAAVAKRDCTADKQADGLALHLDCTGLYSDFAAKTISDDAKPYTPGVEFWSDGAQKARFLFLPAGTKIDITDFDDWQFPIGTKVWKEFTLAGKRIETRLFMKTTATDWKHTSYRWNDAQTEAVRKDSGEKIATTAGAAPYEMPNTGQCDACHGGRTDQLLGVEAVSLGIASAKGVTLASLAAEGRFDRAPPVTSIKIPDGNGGTAAPALGWLHANCGACHAKGGSSQTTLYWRLRVGQLGSDAGVQGLDSWTTAVNHLSARVDDDAGTFYLRIAGGDPTKSLASILSGRRVAVELEPNSTVQMPPLVTRRVDIVGHKLLDDWITQL